MMKKCSKVQEGNLYKIPVGKSEKVIMVISNENDEPYSQLVRPQTVLVERSPKGLFSLPFLHDNDVLMFAHAYYASTTKLNFLEAQKPIGRASRDIIDLIRMTCGRHFSDDPNYYRGLIEEVIRYNKEMKDLTGSELIIVDPDAKVTLSRDLQTTKWKGSKLSFEEGVKRLLSLPSFCRSWTNEDLFLFLDMKNMYGRTALMEALHYSSDNAVTARAAGIKRELKNRGIDPEKRAPIKKEKEVVKSPEKKLKTPESIPERKRPQFIYSPKTWTRNELKTFCEDLDTYTMDTIMKMYTLAKPLTLQQIDQVRSCYLGRKPFTPPH